jgi:hypothetical protein
VRIMLLKSRHASLIKARTSSAVNFMSAAYLVATYLYQESVRTSCLPSIARLFKM